MERGESHEKLVLVSDLVLVLVSDLVLVLAVLAVFLLDSSTR